MQYQRLLPYDPPALYASDRSCAADTPSLPLSRQTPPPWTRRFVRPHCRCSFTGHLATSRRLRKRRFMGARHRTTPSHHGNPIGGFDLRVRAVNAPPATAAANNTSIPLFPPDLSPPMSMILPWIPRRDRCGTREERGQGSGEELERRTRKR